MWWQGAYTERGRRETQLHIPPSESLSIQRTRSLSGMADIYSYFLSGSKVGAGRLQMDRENNTFKFE